MTKINKSKQGKANRKKGLAFELRVRKHLEQQGYIVAKWTNNVSEIFQTDIGDYERNLIPAKKKFNPFTKRVMAQGTGFPDFLIFKPGEPPLACEVKSIGYLDKEEKLKCDWLLSKGIFSRILIASKGKKKGEIVYKEYKRRGEN